MRNPFFRFKQFTVWHDRCAMKVGTDGVLLGAWVSLDQARNVLDIGTGSGLIALMIAQRCLAQITGIDIDADAIGQASENASASPWGNRIRFYQADANSFQNGVYDTIVSNPPYFRERVHCPDGQRNAARHTESLTFENRVLMTFVRTIQACDTAHLIIEESPRVYSPEYAKLVGDFYLNLSV